MIIKSNRIYMEDGCKPGYLEIEGTKIANYYAPDADVEAAFEKYNLNRNAEYRVLSVIGGNNNGKGFRCRN